MAVAELDQSTGAISLRSNSPGPAGSLVVEFDGVTLGLDAADPSLVNFIDVLDVHAKAGIVGTPPCLAGLIGDEATALGALAAAHDERPRRIESADDGREQPVPPHRSPGDCARRCRGARAVASGGFARAVGGADDRTAFGGWLAIYRGAMNDWSWQPLLSSALCRAARTVGSRNPGGAADVCDTVSEWLPEQLGSAPREVAARIRFDTAGSDDPDEADDVDPKSTSALAFCALQPDHART